MKKPTIAGLDQPARYIDFYGCSEGWLAVFDRRVEVGWDEKLFFKKEIFNGKTINIVEL